MTELPDRRLALGLGLAAVLAPFAAAKAAYIPNGGSGGGGGVTGPGASGINHLASYAGTNGQVLLDSGVTAVNGNLTAAQLLGSQIILSGASVGQTLSCAFGNGNFSGGAVQLTDNSSGASFIASIAGTTLTVTSVSSGTIASNQYVNFGSPATAILITAQLTGPTGGAGTYSLATSATQSSIPMQSYTYATAFAGVATLNRAGGQAFGLFAEAILNTNGTVANEFDSFNNTGVNPSGLWPPGQVFGTVDYIPIALQLVAQGNAQSKVGLQIIPGSNSFQAGVYMWPGASSNYGIFVDATAGVGPVAPAFFRSSQTQVAITAQTMGSPSPTLNTIQLLNSAGVAQAWFKANGFIGNAGVTIGADGFLYFTAPTIGTTATGGTAGVLPGAPVGYLEVVISGTVRKIPYYAV